MSKPLCGLLGRSLKHSFSVSLHRELGNPHYQLYEVEPERLAFFFENNSIGLLNVTIPYKKAVMPYCATLSREAQAIGSVNTIVTTPAGLHGHNTDADGLAYLAQRAGISFENKKALILGSGGASATAQYVARQAGARRVVVVSRNGVDTYENLSKHRDAEILVNATPVGMYPAEIGQSVANLEQFPCCEGVLDLVYNPLRTALIMQAEERGIACGGGLPMLVAQAKAAEELFLEQRIPGEENERILGLLLAEKENIVLIGMPGSGKSTIGAALAKLMNRTLVDLDEKIIQAAEKGIPEIFSQDGEEVFRRIESEQAAYYGAKTGLIIATGGGIVMRERNYAPLRQNGRLYHIVRDTAHLGRRGRPLSLEADLDQLYAERLPWYALFSDVVVKNSGTPQEAAEQIRSNFETYTRH